MEEKRVCGTCANNIYVDGTIGKCSANMGGVCHSVIKDACESYFQNKRTLFDIAENCINPEARIIGKCMACARCGRKFT